MSSLRKQGPITTGFSCCGEAVEQRLSKQTPRRMGPCFRRDDEEQAYPGGSEAKSGAMLQMDRPVPDCASLHPGYDADQALERSIDPRVQGEVEHCTPAASSDP